ncbi:MAG TPA: FkbM family methyltransferase [Micropepsaceae bacterium]|nr:FkbM family methyltransferase [Micropepsaceae bacterium]
MTDLPLRLSDGTLIYLAPSLNTITTYVLLEQEAWFEKEAKFVPLLIKPGMTVLDIGANVGVYSLPLARRAAPTGRVYAYEPASEPRRLLEKSKDANTLHNLTVVGAALSDRSRRAHLDAGISSELHKLADRDKDDNNSLGESVPVTSLDEEDAIRNWGSPDFVKIDAEGEEQRILAGGQNFFTRNSPLVMFEVKAEKEIDKAIPAAFRALGYRIFRLLPGAPILVPVETGDTLDTFELNLFAAKPDRAAALAHEGWLADEIFDWSPDENARAHALDLIATQPFGPAVAGLPVPAMGSPYRDALAGYAQWRSPSATPSLRYAALRFSYATLQELCQAKPQTAYRSTFARVAWELGFRKSCIETLQALLTSAREGISVAEPFWPANARFDAIRPAANPGQWFIAGLLEQLEIAAAYSSIFTSGGTNLDWLRREPFVSAEIERRHMLRQLRAGMQLAVPDRLCRSAADHLNAELWRSGAIPNTLRP